MTAPEGLVVFDIGDTLVTGPSSGPASRIAARLAMGAEAKRALHLALMTTAFEGPAPVAAFLRERLQVEGAEVESVVTEVWRAQEHEPAPVAGADRLLAALRDRGYVLALLSNIWPPYVTGARVHFGAFFDAHIPPELQLFSFRTGEMKPSPAPFRRVLAGTGVAADRAVMVGDSYAKDIAPAAALGMKTIWTLHRPEKQIDDVVRVLDRGSPMPSRTVRSIASVDVESVGSLLGTP